MTWDDFKGRTYSQLDLKAGDVRLGYRISTESRRWMALTCEADWNIAVKRLQEKASSARTRAAALELKNMVSNVFFSIKAVLTWLEEIPKKGLDKGKKKEKEKCTREDDIPPELTPEGARLERSLAQLKRRWYCTAHSKPGIKTYCWIAPTQANGKGGHRQMEYKDLCLWAKYIVS